MTPMPMQWYVIRVATNQEDKVRERLLRRVKADKLENRIPEVLVPVERVTEIKSGRKKVKTTKIYPGYILIKAALGQDGSDEPEDQRVWFALHETPGFQDFVGGGKGPVPMSDEEAKSILARMEQSESQPRLAVRIKKGDMVRIKEGPFEGFDGTVEEVLESQGKLRISVTIFGRATSVEIEHWLVELV
ncbi:MAG: transcription termination/antitermination factor NusG [Planctomycetota bacterium]|nr:MAG: transcription termination/antitermination factor NusG [Planctomycetota bacterium]